MKITDYPDALIASAVAGALAKQDYAFAERLVGALPPTRRAVVADMLSKYGDPTLLDAWMASKEPR